MDEHGQSHNASPPLNALRDETVGMKEAIDLAQKNGAGISCDLRSRPCLIPD
jgi:hypothetical protein